MDQSPKIDILTLALARQGGGGGGSGDVPAEQATTTIIQDPLVNLNGRFLSNYEATLHEKDPESLLDFTYYKITKGGNDLTEEEATAYMEYMTGSSFLPTYNYEKPQNSLFIMPDHSVWKPQWMTSGPYAGLYLFKVSDGGSGDISSLIEEITYAELKAKRDAGQLVPGMKYRIVDFVTTVNTHEQGNYKSAFNPFDIIVTATSANTLSENAKAAINVNDANHFNKETREIISAQWESGVEIADIEFQYKIAADQSIYDEEKPGDSDIVIQQLSTKRDLEGRLVPAMLNPAPSSFIWHSDIVNIYFEEFDDEIEYEEQYHKEDVFVKAETINGTPVLYKTYPKHDDEPGLDNPDLSEPFYYVNNIEVDGDVYNRWRKYENNTPTNRYVYTNIVVRNGVFDSGVTTEALIAGAHEVYEPSENDVWYIYNGVIIIDNEEYDFWREYSEYTGWEDYYHTTNHVVNAEFNITVQPRVNLSAWDLKYSLDNDEKFLWASDCQGHQAIRVVDNESENSNYLYKRYPKGDTETQICWAYVTDDADLNDPDVDWDDFDNTDIILTSKIVRIGDVVGDGVYTVIDVSGRGLIYWMRDDFGNEAPFDFKNILCFIAPPDETSDYYYVFNGYRAGIDATVFYGKNCFNNTIKDSIDWDWDEDVYFKKRLPQVLMRVSETSKLSYNTVGSAATGVIIDANINWASYNTVGVNGANIYIIASRYNTIGDECSSINIQANCNNNILGNRSKSIYFSNYCSYNTIGDNSSISYTANDIWFGVSCSYNTIGKNCRTIALGNENERVSIGDGCSYITLGNSAYDINIGSGSTYIWFKNVNNTTVNWVRNVTFEGACSYVRIASNSPGSNTNYIQNLTFHHTVGDDFTYTTTYPNRNWPQVDYYLESGSANFLEVSKHSRPELYRHNITLDLEASGFDKQIQFNIITPDLSSYSTMGLIFKVQQNPAWLKNIQVTYTDDTSGQRFLVCGIWDAFVTMTNNFYVLTMEAWGNNGQYEFIFNQDCDIEDTVIPLFY